jgi:3-mercaptopyruvate sulfurtransferase SseA
MLRKILNTAALVLIVYKGNALSGDISNLVVDSRFVNDKHGKPSWAILDIRTGEEYKGGHIPGAVSLGNAAAHAA